MAERHNGRQGRQEGPVLILWTTGAKGSFWAGWRTHTQRCCELAARMICLELSSVGLRLQSTVGSPGSLMQVQIPKPIPTSDPAAVVEAEGQPAFSHFSNRNPVPLLLSLCSPGRTDARPLRPWFPGMGTRPRPGLSISRVGSERNLSVTKAWPISISPGPSAGMLGTLSFHC